MSCVIKFMAGRKKLGFFWGSQKLYIVQTSDNLITVKEILSFVANDQTEDIRLTAAVQKFFRDTPIGSTQARVSLSPHETIIRSFLIPYLKPNEIDTVVEFEAKKYIPFSLRELVYRFHPLVVVEKKVKKLQVVFVAVRALVLERYRRILEQGKMTVVLSEPASFSVLRVLLFKKIISPDQRAAILQIDAGMARISFVSEETVPFMREFELTSPDAETGAPVPDAALDRARFLNEIRNSLDFYSRQSGQKNISQIVVLSSAAQTPFAQWLKEDLEIPIRPVDLVSIVGNQAPEELMGMLHAYGASLANEATSDKLNFSRKPVKRSILLPFDMFTIKQYMGALKTAAVCAAVLLGIFVFIQVELARYKNMEEGLKESVKKYADLTTDDLVAKLDKTKLQFKNYQNLEFKSSITPIFVYIPELLPSGVWLQEFLVELPRAGVSSGQPQGKKEMTKSGVPIGRNIKLVGYVYTEDPNLAIKVVNDLVNRIKKEKKLAKFFNDVKLVDMQRYQVDGRQVVLLQITCS